MKCFTCQRGVVTPSIRTERMTIQQGKVEISAVSVGSKYRNGLATLVSITGYIPSDNAITNGVITQTRTGKTSIRALGPTDIDRNSCLVLFASTPGKKGLTVHNGELLKTVPVKEGAVDYHLMPFPGIVHARGSMVQSEGTSSEQLLATLPRGKVVSIIYTGMSNGTPDVSFLVFDGVTLHICDAADRDKLEELHPLHPSKHSDYFSWKE